MLPLHRLQATKPGAEPLAINTFRFTLAIWSSCMFDANQARLPDARRLGGLRAATATATDVVCDASWQPLLAPYVSSGLIAHS